MSAGSLGVGCWEADICRVFLLLDKLNQLSRPHRGGSEPSEQKGGEQSQGGSTDFLWGAAPRQEFRVKRWTGCTPLPVVWGQGPSLLTTVREGGTCAKGRASPGCWGTVLGVMWRKLRGSGTRQAETHFSSKMQALTRLLGCLPCNPLGHQTPELPTPQRPFKGILLLSHRGLRKPGGSTGERRLPREA